MSDYVPFKSICFDIGATSGAAYFNQFIIPGHINLLNHVAPRNHFAGFFINQTAESDITTSSEYSRSIIQALGSCFIRFNQNHSLRAANCWCELQMAIGSHHPQTRPNLLKWDPNPVRYWHHGFGLGIAIFLMDLVSRTQNNPLTGIPCYCSCVDQQLLSGVVISSPVSDMLCDCHTDYFVEDFIKVIQLTANNILRLVFQWSPLLK